MTVANQRITVLVTPAGKVRIVETARRAGLSNGEFVRRSAAAFDPGRDNDAVSALIDQVSRTTRQAGAALDNASAFLEASNKRIANAERKHRRRAS